MTMWLRLSVAGPAGAAKSARALSQFARPPPMTKGVVSPYRPVPDSIAYPEYWRSGRTKTSPSYVVAYTEEEIPKIRKAARLARKVLEFCLKHAQPGVSTEEIDRLAHEEIIKHGAYPSPLNYSGFPKSICTSVNDVICHGIPDSTVLREGDTISIDVSVYLDGYHGDNCGAVNVGAKVDPKLDALIAATKEAVDKAIEVCGPGRCITEIGKAIEGVANKRGYGIVANFCGHGTGRLLHMQPLIQHVINGDRFKMVPGMVFTIEPILVEGSGEIYTWRDGWTAATTDGTWGAQVEHEVLITDKGVEVLTIVE